MKMWHSPSLQPLFNREPDDEAMDFRIFRIYYDKHRQTLQKRRIKELVMTFLRFPESSDVRHPATPEATTKPTATGWGTQAPVSEP